MARILDFADGWTSSSEPQQTFLKAASLQSFASDADFITFKTVPAAQGDCYHNSTTGRIRFYNGTDWVSVVSEDSAGNLTLEADLTVEGNLTVQGTTTTLNTQTLDVEDLNITVNKGGDDTTAQGAGLTVERTGTDGSLVYDSSKASKWKAGNVGTESEVVTVSDTQTLTNKTLTSPAINSPSGITKSDVGLSNVDNTSDINKPVSTATQTALNLKADSTQVATDIAAAVSTKADTSTVTAHTSATSAHGVAGAVVGTSDTQVITNKDIDGGTASNTSRITLPKAPKATLDSLSRKEATLVYASDQDKVFVDDGTNLKEIGSGGGNINFLSNPDGGTGVTGWTEGSYAAATRPSGSFTASSGASAFSISTTTINPLGIGTTSFLLTKAAGASRQGRAVVTDFALPLSYRAKNLSIGIDYIINSGSFVAGSSGSDSSLIWYCAFSTDSGATYTTAEPNNFKLLSNSTLNSDKLSTNIQTPHNATHMRLIAYVAEATNSAWEVKCIASISPVVALTIATNGPVGSIVATGSLTPPSGYLYADGTAVSRTAYSELFKAIGTTYGVGDGSTTFNLPDLRGVFVRGAGSQTIGAETYSATLGQKQNDATAKNGLTASSTQPAHAHGPLTYFNAAPGGTSVVGISNTSTSTVDITTSVAPVITTTIGTGDAETRPANVAVAYHICFNAGSVQVSDSVVWTDDVGQIVPFAKTANPTSFTDAPAGYLYADGSEVSRATYSELFSKIGTAYGAGNGSTTFNLPNLKGIFVRGAGSQTFGSETYSATAGTKQNDATAKNGLTATSSQDSHQHSLYGGGSAIQGIGNGSTSVMGASSANGYYVGQIGSAQPNVYTTINSSDAETRPANMALHYFIKYTRTAAPSISESPTVGALYTGAPPTGTLNGSYNLVTFGTKVKDSHGAYSGGVYTIPSAGQYDIEAKLSILSTHATTTSNSSVAIFIDGSPYSIAIQYATVASSQNLYPAVNIKAVPLKAGQTVEVRSRTFGSSASFESLASVNQFSITRSGGY